MEYHDLHCHFLYHQSAMLATGIERRENNKCASTGRIDDPRSERDTKTTCTKTNLKAQKKNLSDLSKECQCRRKPSTINGCTWKAFMRPTCPEGKSKSV